MPVTASRVVREASWALLWPGRVLDPRDEQTVHDQGEPLLLLHGGLDSLDMTGPLKALALTVTVLPFLNDEMVIGSASFTRVGKVLAPARTSLGRKVNPVVMPADAFRSKLKARDRFAWRIVREPTILQTGDASELGKLIENWAA
jgi:hypothetical protein